MACHQHTQQHHQNVLRDFQKCSYGPTTTQQQAYNKSPAGFSEWFQNSQVNESNFHQAHTKTYKVLV